jgi:intracellular multiplication protein IcmN
MIVMLIVSCHSTIKTPLLPQKLPTTVAGASDQQIVKLEQSLKQKGVNIIVLGQLYMVSIPSSLIFADESPKINWDSYALLNEIVEYLRKFRKISAYVNGYNSCYINKRRTDALTLARAQEISNYLWQQDIDSRLIFTRGMGSDKPIAASVKCGDTSPNSRVEIVFKRAII